MFIVVETWTPNARFIEADESVRGEVLERVKEGARQMASAGIEAQGWGSISASADHPSGYDWFAVWSIPSADLVDQFLTGVAASGWYEWFDQINVHGEARSIDVVLNELRTLGAER